MNHEQRLLKIDEHHRRVFSTSSDPQGTPLFKTLVLLLYSCFFEGAYLGGQKKRRIEAFERIIETALPDEPQRHGVQKEQRMDEHPSDCNALIPKTLAIYFSAGHPAEQRLAEEPLRVLGIDPPHGKLMLYTSAMSSDIDISAYRMIHTDTIEEPRDETVWFRVTVETKDIEYETHSLLQAITDQLRQGDDLERTLYVAFDASRRLLACAPRLSENQEIELFGELAVLDRLIDGVGEAKALAAWLGPWAEEHDFILGEADVEVKTTRGERHIYVTHGPGQLTPTPGRLLHLMSAQVTEAGAADNGRTLPKLIKRICRRLQSRRTDFSDGLTDCRWKGTQADRLYTMCLLVRSEPRFYAVDETFPAITSVGLSRIVTRPELVRNIDYRIDVTDLKPEGTASAELAAVPMYEN